MQTRAPSFGQIAIAIGFALSCFGLLLFLWTAFGGPVPLGSKGYRITVPVTEATQLGTEADVRISGVSVGKVKGIELGDANAAEAVIELDSDHAPVPADTRAVLRQKTLLGETYMELTPGTDGGPTVPEGGELPAAQVAKSVQLDEVFRTFDEPTREGFQTWMEDGATAVEGRAGDLNAALGNLDPFTEEGARLMRLLDQQRLAVSQLLRDGGETFEALSERQGALRGLIENSEAVFSTTADRDRQLAEIFRIMPTFLDESRLTLARLGRFSDETNPLITQLRPVARELGPTAIELERLAPQLERFFEGLLPTARLSPRGFRALRALLDEDLGPLLRRLVPFTNELNPVVRVVRSYRREITAFFANTAAATNAFTNPEEANGRRVRYLRTTSPIGPEALSSYPLRLSSNRTNPYVKPGGYENLRQTLESFQTNHCGGAGLEAWVDLDDDAGFPPNPPTAGFPDTFVERLHEYAFSGVPTRPGNIVSSEDVPTPRCAKQEPFRSVGGPPQERSDYLHVRPDE
jgi:phospholipid/cholesterol/gamma-HCH transport system substrate-binding protein